jgi:hypothetical protein
MCTTIRPVANDWGRIFSNVRDPKHPLFAGLSPDSPKFV